MCQQRLQEGKLEAKKAGISLPDGLIKTACQQACPTKAISFGDVNDKESDVAKLRTDDRHFFLLEEVGVKPTVSYLVKVRNVDEQVTFYNEEHGSKEKTHSEGHGEEHKEEKHS
jgi:molybdopterin-containing oxidoreductase family iron-sulfur binding subunit